MTRYFELDLLRGIAVLMMIVFHLLFYSNYFGITKLILYSGIIGFFQKIIPIIFLLVSGFSTSLLKKKKGKKGIIKNGFKIFFLGLLITLFTTIFFNESYVLFGILHLIGFSIIVSPLFNKRLALIIGVIILLISPLVNDFIVDYKILSIIGFKYVNLNSFDYYPIIPWFGLFLIGLFIGSIIKLKEKKVKNNVVKFFCFIGRKSLIIYFIHIPMLFSITYLIGLIK